MGRSSGTGMGKVALFLLAAIGAMSVGWAAAKSQMLPSQTDAPTVTAAAAPLPVRYWQRYQMVTCIRTDLPRVFNHNSCLLDSDTGRLWLFSDMALANGDVKLIMTPISFSRISGEIRPTDAAKSGANTHNATAPAGNGTACGLTDAQLLGKAPLPPCAAKPPRK